MRANKAKDTAPELKLRRALFASGKRGYRLHVRSLPGRPDIVFSRTMTAIFVNGCFWHRCPYCKLPLPKSNLIFWKKKFKRNKERDIEKIKKLKALGWKVHIFWECQINEDTGPLVRLLKEPLTND